MATGLHHPCLYIRLVTEDPAKPAIRPCGNKLTTAIPNNIPDCVNTAGALLGGTGENQLDDSLHFVILVIGREQRTTSEHTGRV